MVVKGVVCKKNVAHRRMSSKIEKPRFLILGGALEYQRVTNMLSSVDTLLQQVCRFIASHCLSFIVVACQSGREVVCLQLFYISRVSFRKWIT